jgi:hypothetical protein
LALLDGLKPVHAMEFDGETYLVYIGSIALLINISVSAGMTALLRVRHR